MKEQTRKNNFLHYIHQLSALLQESKTNSNPAMYLHNKGARTTAFMLQGLSRLYKELHNAKRFKKMQEKFKTLEDALGQVDLYNALVQSKALANKDAVVVKAYFQELLDESCTLLNIILEQNYFKKNEPFFKTIKKINEADWFKPEEEANAIAKFYTKESKEVEQFGKELPFTDMELHVHEWRRKLRWLSIYPQALDGLIQLENTAIDIKWNKYLTPAVINSPYNTLPDGSPLPYHVWLHKPAFLALSWMIQELGNLKDEGLMQHAITKGILKITPDMDGNAAYELAKKWCGSKLNDQQILDNATAITKTFIEDKALQVL
jgi:hypothetical protein